MPRTVFDETINGILEKFREEMEDKNIGLWVFKYHTETSSLESWDIKSIDGKDADELGVNGTTIRYGEGTIGYLLAMKNTGSADNAIIAEDCEEDPRGAVSLIDNRIKQKSAFCFLISDGDKKPMVVLDFFHNRPNYFCSDNKDNARNTLENILYNKNIGMNLALLHKIELERDRHQKLVAVQELGLRTETELVNRIKTYLCLNIPLSLFFFQRKEKDKDVSSLAGFDTEFLKTRLIREIKWCSYKSTRCDGCFMENYLQQSTHEDNPCFIRELTSGIRIKPKNKEKILLHDSYYILYYLREENEIVLGIINEIIKILREYLPGICGCEYVSNSDKRLNESIERFVDYLVSRNVGMKDLCESFGLKPPQSIDEEIRETFERDVLFISILKEEHNVPVWSPKCNKDFMDYDKCYLFKFHSSIKPLYAELLKKGLVNPYKPLAEAEGKIICSVSENLVRIEDSYNEKKIIDWYWERGTRNEILYIDIPAIKVLEKEIAKRYLSGNPDALDLPKQVEDILDVSKEEKIQIPDGKSDSDYRFIIYPRTSMSDVDAETKKEIKDNIESYISHIHSIYESNHQKSIAYENALRSGIAAIMSRNMAHLLGSHIEPGIQNDIKSFVEASMQSKFFETLKQYNSLTNLPENKFNRIKESIKKYGINKILTSYPDSEDALLNLIEVKEKALDRYSIYRQRRMDFIARISTDWPYWKVGYEFYKHLVIPFMENSMLLHYVGYSDGFKIQNIDFTVKVNDTLIKEKHGSNCLQPIDLIHFRGLPPPNDNSMNPTTENYSPVILGCRGGDMGVQAFNIILENFIRNCIKHNKKLRENKDFKVGIFLYEDRECLEKKFTCFEDKVLRLGADEKCVYIVVSSSVGESDDDIQGMDKKICKPVITKTGEIDPEAWGIKEIKIAAAFLKNENPDVCNVENPDFIQAGNYLWDEDSDSHLAYCFMVPKLYYVGVLENE